MTILYKINDQDYNTTTNPKKPLNVLIVINHLSANATK